MSIRLPSRPSANKKLGPKFYATYRKVGLASEGGTCPQSCPQLKERGCYALYGNVNVHQKDASFDEDDLARVRGWLYGRVPRKGFYVRHLVSGDLGGADGKPDLVFARGLRDLHQEVRIRGFGYTHFWRELEPEDVNNAWLTFNASCESLEDAKQALEAGWPIALVVPADAPAELEPLKLDGQEVRVKVCKAQLDPSATCSTCMICLKRDRNEVVAFRAHAPGAKHVKTA